MGLFKNVGDKIGSSVKNISKKVSDKIKGWNEENTLHKKLEEAFKNEKNAVIFTVHFVNGKKKEFTGLLDYDKHIIRLDADLNKSEVIKITDKKGNEYFIVRINPTKFCFESSVQTGVDEYTTMEKELDEIEYTNQKPKEEKQPIYNQTTYNIKNDDHSTNYKGVKNSNINSQDAKVDTKKEVSVDVSANLQHKKGE